MYNIDVLQKEKRNIFHAIGKNSDLAKFSGDLTDKISNAFYSGGPSDYVFGMLLFHYYDAASKRTADPEKTIILFSL